MSDPVLIQFSKPFLEPKSYCQPKLHKKTEVWSLKFLSVKGSLGTDFFFFVSQQSAQRNALFTAVYNFTKVFYQRKSE